VVTLQEEVRHALNDAVAAGFLVKESEGHGHGWGYINCQYAECRSGASSGVISTASRTERKDAATAVHRGEKGGHDAGP